MKEEKKIRKKIKIEDLLPRDPIRVDLDAILGYVKGKTILVTGGGGSIGSEICRQLAGHDVGHLIIFDIYENNAYQIQKSLEWEFPDLNLTVLIGSVRDERRLESIFSKYWPDIVFHAAAHKHVPLMEDSPNEAIKNNVIGTLKTARTASHYQVKKFILISTDKAVNPTNIMGASKRLCEMVIQLIGRHSTTEFAAVRFGNVLGSNGSVIPLFRRQIEHGGPVTVTHPERYFCVQDTPELLYEFREMGAVLQINKGSVFGRFGEEAERTARFLLENRLAGCVASDAHGADYRTTDMRPVRQFLEERYGEAYAQLLVKVNPRRILEDRQIFYEPSPERKRKRRWFL